MKIYAVSDIHLDYEDNQRWIKQLSLNDYQNDILILAGDISDSLQLLTWCFEQLSRRFQKVFYVTGNHELWIIRDKDIHSSWDKFLRICQLAEQYNISMTAGSYEQFTIVPLLSWYDFSFAEPEQKLLDVWGDFKACSWDETPVEITKSFHQKNNLELSDNKKTIISFSHFLPRKDLMPEYVPQKYHYLFPIFGAKSLDLQLRQLGSTIHIYGHSHINRCVKLDGITYINNAFGYPQETNITAKSLLCIYDTESTTQFDYA